jgi:hypothetical protein
MHSADQSELSRVTFVFNRQQFVVPLHSEWNGLVTDDWIARREPHSLTGPAFGSRGPWAANQTTKSNHAVKRRGDGYPQWHCAR